MAPRATAARLGSVETPGGDRCSHLYDWRDYRFEQIEPGSPAMVDYYVWDEQDPLFWLQSPSGAQQMFVRGNGLIRALGTTASPLSRQCHLVAQGSPLALTTSDGSLETTCDFDAWGSTLSGSASDNPACWLGSPGCWSEPVVSLSYVGARWLDPTTGRSISLQIPVENEHRFRRKVNAESVQSER